MAKRRKQDETPRAQSIRGCIDMIDSFDADQKADDPEYGEKAYDLLHVLRDDLAVLAIQVDSRAQGILKLVGPE
jgi:hypothetical protein